MGIDEFVFSGYPQMEELYWFGEGVVPLLRERGLYKGVVSAAAPASVPFVGSARRLG